jgi:6-phosphogluconolactonase (cycloisomerase 2 family)
VYAANATAANDVAGFTITPSTGALTAVGASVASGSLPASLAVDPAGTFAYVANADANDVSVFSIAGGTGVLSVVSGSPFLTGSTPRSITVH